MYINGFSIMRKFLIIFLLFVTGCAFYSVQEIPPGKTYQQLANDKNECIALFVRLNPDEDIVWANNSDVYGNCMRGKGYNVHYGYRSGW
jgi:hypothetical protein